MSEFTEEPKPVLLVDMDQTTFDFHGQVLNFLKPSVLRILDSQADGAEDLIRNSEHFYTRDTLAVHLGKKEATKIEKELFYDRKFWETMTAMPGAISGILAVREAGVEVRLCTSAPLKAPWAEAGKRLSIIRAFAEAGEETVGRSMASSAFVGADKSLASGAVLLDDNPKAGKNTLVVPDWEQILMLRQARLEAATGFMWEFRPEDWENETAIRGLISITKEVHERNQLILEDSSG